MLSVQASFVFVFYFVLVLFFFPLGHSSAILLRVRRRPRLLFVFWNAVTDICMPHISARTSARTYKMIRTTAGVQACGVLFSLRLFSGLPLFPSSCLAFDASFSFWASRFNLLSLSLYLFLSPATPPLAPLLARRRCPGAVVWQVATPVHRPQQIASSPIPSFPHLAIHGRTTTSLPLTDVCGGGEVVK